MYPLKRPFVEPRASLTKITSVIDYLLIDFPSTIGFFREVNAFRFIIKLELSIDRLLPQRCLLRLLIYALFH